MIDSFSGEYSFLSNFHLCRIEHEGIIYPSTEHAYQAAKTLDEQQRKQIANAPTPSKAKKMGRKVTLRNDWEDVKLDVMMELVKKKFQNKELANKLLATGSQKLVEGNYWHDYYWGVCNGKGQNHLGKILMEIREELLRGMFDVSGRYLNPYN